MLDASIIVCTWNRAQSLATLLATLDQLKVPEPIVWEVLVVDNNSTDDTRAVCESFVAKNPGRFHYLFEGKQGKSNALNAGINRANGSILAFTDDDVTVHPDWLAGLLGVFQKFDCAAVAGKIVATWNCPRPPWVVLDGPFRHPAFGGIVHFDKGESAVQLHSSAAGANIAFRRAVFEKHSLFRTDLSGNHADRRRGGDLLGGEDTEFCQRILRAGECLMYAPGAIVYHPVDEHRTTRKYLQQFAFQYGRWLARMDGMRKDMKSLFGFPRYLLPISVNCLLRWFFSFGTLRRFFYRLEFFQTLGQMTEGKRMLQTLQAPRAASVSQRAN